MEVFLLIGGLGVISGFLSGLLGIGGGIVLAPLLLFAPPFFGLEPLSMRVVAGLTVVQGLAACLSGALTHHKFNFVSDRLALCMGGTIFVAAAVGGAGARFASNQTLLFVFACLAFAAAILLLIPVGLESEQPNVKALEFSWRRAVTTAAGVGLLGGLVGQGGSFILIPLMTSYVRIPTRIAIGSNLAIVLLSSLAALIGKMITGQIQWLLALPVVLTVIPAAALGGLVSQQVPVLGLRRLLAIFIGLAAFRMWWSLLLGPWQLMAF